MAEENTAAQNAQAPAAEISRESFTAEQLAWIDGQIESNADRRVNQAQAKWAKESERKASLAAMDADQRAQAERDQRIAELLEENKALKIAQNAAELKGVLASRGLSADFGDLIRISENAEDNSKTIAAFDRLFKAAVAAAVKDRLGAAIPSVGESNGGAITKEQFQKMTVREQTEIYNRDPELWKRLTE